jgi:transcriptional regulator with XRE-family HTH domain
MPDGRSLAALRALARLSQSDVASRMSISVPAVSQIERRDYVRNDTASRYQLGVLDAVRDEAISGLLADSMAALVSRAAERGLFVRELRAAGT